MDAKVKTTVTMKVSGSCPTHARSDISVRDVETVVDEPIERGGSNLGLTPTETLVAALIGCTNVIANKIAHGKGLHIERMDVDAHADLDRRGVLLQEDIAVPFPKIALDIHIVSNDDPDAFKAVQADLEKFCAISKVIRQSGTQIVENWTITKP